MIPPPMTPSHLAPLRARAAAVTMAAALALAGCSSDQPTRTPEASIAGASALATPTPTPTLLPTPTPTPTPQPTPRFTNEPDDELAALIPDTVAGVPVVVAPFDEFALTPGDIGLAYGEIGARFESLVLAYVEQPRVTLYAVRVDGEEVTTDDLEPHLATAGRYVGIAGLDPEPWEKSVVAGTQVWVRGEDVATAAGTRIYTWSSGDYVFLLIGVDDTVNQAFVDALPGEPAPSPTPSPSASTPDQPSPSATPSPEG